MESPAKASPVHPGFTRTEIHKTTWDVPQRYDGLEAVGSGAYGTVCSALDKRTKEKVAIKKLYRPFQSLILAKRAYRELRLLRHIENDNEKVAIKKLYRPFQSLILAKRAYRELRLLRHIENDNVISLLDVYTPDSSLEKFQTLHTESEMTGYVVTRWYRAPEIIFNWMHYSQSGNPPSDSPSSRP
ncbi:hypothetical protein CRUP_025256 [Coryphaenoides rupestris]|nr:hypothetical protein CRUP_025256 [Coryphaenoides rupestris]